MVQALPPLGPLHGGFVRSRLREWMRRGPKCRKLKGSLFRIIKQTNKNYPVGEKQTGWLDKAGQGRTRLDRKQTTSNIR